MSAISNKSEHSSAYPTQTHSKIEGKILSACWNTDRKTSRTEVKLSHHRNSSKQMKMVTDSHHTPKNTPSKATPKKMGPKAISLEDLTPAKKCKAERAVKGGAAIALKSTRNDEEWERQRTAAVKICRFMMTSAWRRRKDEVRCLRRTLECQMSCSERLRLQTWTLKSLLDADNRKVKLALCELDKLKQLLQTKEQQRLVLDKEKRALEQDVLDEQDRSSQLLMGLSSTRQELEAARAALASCEEALGAERGAACLLRTQLMQAAQKTITLEAECRRKADELERAECTAEALREESEAKEQLLNVALERLDQEIRMRAKTETERAALVGRVCDTALETGILKLKVCELQGEVERLGGELARTRTQLECWPGSLTKMMMAVRSWLNSPLSLRSAILWSVLPARHGC